MKIDHKEYLERLLLSRQLELDELNIQHRVNIAVYNEKREMISKQIHSLNIQLEKEN